MSDKIEYLVETDILVEHLTGVDSSSKSWLETAMQKGICFTTVINASELYYTVKNDDQKKQVDALLNSLKVLGLHARYSLSISEFSNNTSTVRDALICSVAKNNKLPILTAENSRYSGTGIKFIHPDQL